MKSKIIHIIISITFINSCGTCDESDPTATYTLTEFEISLIPFTQHNDLSYLDEAGNLLLATTQPKIIEDFTTSPHVESCQYSEHQRISSFLTFKSKDISIQINLEKYDEPSFLLTHYYPDFQETLGLAENSTDFSINEAITDVSLLGFDFENVLIFEHSNQDSETKLIVYSIENGVELIEYRNGNYLKLIL